MQRRRMFLAALLNSSAVGFISGCRNKQYAHVLKKDDKDMVGSHVAGAETWKPLIDESVGRLLAKSCSTVHQASHSTVEGEGIPIRTVCFVGVENRSAEEIGDFKEQIYEHIDSLNADVGPSRFCFRPANANSRWLWNALTNHLIISCSPVSLRAQPTATVTTNVTIC